ncbi:MAG TPA: GNAT family N-acetyltransferase [Rugosimonospora sp.]|nr:GNAT family N-acetyltransferase [Rugosimonospora sp.]
MALWRIRATVDDRPGFLSVLTASLALRSVNILSVQVHASEGGAIDDFLVDAPDALTEADLRAAVAKGRGRDPWVARTDPYGLVDGPTHLLGLAAKLVREPQELDVALGALMGECTVRWRPDEGPTWQGFTDSAMALPDPSGGTVYVDREAPPFTPAEYARANALVELAGVIAARVTNRWQLLLPGGEEVTVRLAGDDDLDEVTAMYERCSADSRRRYPWPDRLDELLGTGYTLVAGAGSGRVVALGGLAWSGPEAEVGLLVEDAWQRRGLGTALLRRAVRLATAAGAEALRARTRGENSAMIHTLRRLGRPMRHEADGVTVTLTVDLGPDVTAGIGTPSPAR